MNYKLAKLAKQKNPMIVLLAWYNYLGTAKKIKEEVEDLSSELYLSIDSYLMIISNFLVNFHHVNKIMEILPSIVW